MSKKSKTAKTSGAGAVTVGDLICVVGMVLLAITMFMGVSLWLNDYTYAFLYTFGGIGVLGLLLWLICKAKKAVNNRTAWKITEAFGVLAFVAALVGCGLAVSHFFYMASIRGQLAKDAEDDKAAVMSVFRQYRTEESANVERIGQSITSLPRNTSLKARPGDKETQQRFKDRATASENKLELNTPDGYTTRQLSDIAAETTDQLNRILFLTSRYQKDDPLYTQVEDSLGQVVSGVSKGWSAYLNMQSLLKDVDQIQSQLIQKLNERSANQAKYGYRKDGPYVVADTVVYDDNLIETYKPAKLKLAKHFDGTRKSNDMAWPAVAVMGIFILCPYFATHRSRQVRSFRLKGRTDGGIEIC